jgi:hypothetical protein
VIVFVSGADITSNLCWQEMDAQMGDFRKVLIVGGCIAGWIRDTMKRDWQYRMRQWEAESP